MDNPITPAASTEAVSKPEHTAEQILNLQINLNRAHAEGLAVIVAIAGVKKSDLPESLANGPINLITILQQLATVRYVAEVKGYSDILELLDQKLPYQR